MTTNNNRYHRNGDREVASHIHWRRVKDASKQIITRCKANPSDYDFENICCYSVFGSELQGTNVSYTGLKPNSSCFVSDNKYTVLEFGNKNNISSYEGDFFVLAHNESFDYWLGLGMEYKIDYEKTAQTGKLTNYVEYVPLGQYDIRVPQERSGKVELTLTRKAAELNYDTCPPTYTYFDTANNRLSAYGTSSAQIVSGIKGHSYSKNSIVGGNKKVEKFKKTKRK